LGSLGGILLPDAWHRVARGERVQGRIVRWIVRLLALVVKRNIYATRAIQWWWEVVMKLGWVEVTIGVVILFTIGFTSGYNSKDAKLDDCEEVARQTDYFGQGEAARAMAFAECVRPKTYRLRGASAG
jgi:hypothetical protein